MVPVILAGTFFEMKFWFLIILFYFLSLPSLLADDAVFNSGVRTNKFGDSEEFAKQSVCLEPETGMPSIHYERIFPDTIKLSKSLEKNVERINKSRLNDQIKKRLTAAVLTIALGPLGVHRLYLGCPPVVPAVYVATLGGCLGLVPLIDLFAILFTKDLSRYENNPKIFMWMKD